MGDTPNWNNGYSRCSDESLGYWPYCEAGKGWTCAGYAAKGWCKSDRCLSPSETGGGYACGDNLNNPEHNCCECGGGSNQPSCVPEGQVCGGPGRQTLTCCEGNCQYPYGGASQMYCVNSPQCTDTPNWNNGYSRCSDESLGYWPYCEAGKGWTCAGYAAKGWCKSDRCLSPSETGGVYACGDKLNSPELNCCACGGGSKQPSPPTCAYEGQSCGRNHAQTTDCCDDMECTPFVGGGDMQCVKRQTTCVAQGEYCGGPGERTLECCSGACEYPPNSNTMVCR